MKGVNKAGLNCVRIIKSRSTLLIEYTNKLKDLSHCDICQLVFSTQIVNSSIHFTLTA
jgi:hypothetical protein